MWPAMCRDHYCLFAYGKEKWQFNADALMDQRIASTSEHSIAEAKRKLLSLVGRHPNDLPAQWF